MPFTSLGALLALLAVAAGAFGAHALRGRLEPDMLQVFETTVRYQLAHALALLGLGRRGQAAPRAGAAPGATLLLVGTLLFCGSLYALALTGVRAWGAVTPFGGLALLVGWALVARAFWPKR